MRSKKKREYDSDIFRDGSGGSVSGSRGKKALARSSNLYYTSWLNDCFYIFFFQKKVERRFVFVCAVLVCRNAYSVQYDTSIVTILFGAFVCKFTLNFHIHFVLCTFLDNLLHIHYILFKTRPCEFSLFSLISFAYFATWRTAIYISTTIHFCFLFLFPLSTWSESFLHTFSPLFTFSSFEFPFKKKKQNWCFEMVRLSWSFASWVCMFCLCV